MKTRFAFPILALALMLSSACQVAGRHVAVMDFENNTGEKRYDYLESAIPEYVTADLANRQDLTLLERQDVQRYLAEIDFDLQDLRRLSRWQTLGRRVGADYLVAGSVSRLQNNFILTARIFDVRRGRIVSGSSIVGTCVFESQLFDRANHIAAQIAQMLASPGHGNHRPDAPDSEPTHDRAAQPSEPRTPGDGEL